MKILRLATLAMPLLLASCSVIQPTASAPVTQTQSKDAFSAYIAKYNAMAVDQMKKYGIQLATALSETPYSSAIVVNGLFFTISNNFSFDGLSTLL